MSKKNPTRKNPITISQEELERGIVLCKRNGLSYLNAATHLLDIKTEPHTIQAFALWWQAADEFGKLLKLAESRGSDAKVEIQREGWFGGLHAHKNRIQKALERLEIQVFDLKPEIRIVSNINTSTAVINVWGFDVGIGAGMSGIFSDTDTQVEYLRPADEGTDLREDLLYVDLGDDGVFHSPQERFAKQLSVEGLRGRVEVPSELVNSLIERLKIEIIQAGDRKQ